MLTVSEWKQEFLKTVKSSDIVEGDDQGVYYYVDHPLANISFLSMEDQDEYIDFVEDWIYNNRPD